MDEMQRLALLLIGATLVLAACGDEEPEQAGSGTETSTAVETQTAAIPAEWTECANEVEGFAIAYPKGWYTDELSPEQACSFFDPEPFEIVEGSEFPPTALEAHSLGVDQRSFEQVVKDFTNPMFERLVAREDTTVAGFPAVRLETVATGEGLYEKGTLTYGYIVDRDGDPFLVRTTIAHREDAESRKLIVDEAAESLRFFESADAAGQDLPPAVAETRQAIIDAVRAGDFNALRALIPETGFTYTYGGPVEGGPVAHWQALERTTGEAPLTKLPLVLSQPHTKVRDNFVWPFAYDRDPAKLTPRERELLRPIASDEEIGQWAQLGHYLGWRAGIRKDGTWVFYVAGD